MILKHRYAELDLLRLLSLALVMFGHFVLVAGGATEIYGVIGPETKLPLIDANRWGLWHFETFLVNTFTTQSGILGVTLFFLVTGSLIPIMMERYTRTGFLINRFFRIYPPLIVVCGLIGVFVYVTQRVTFPPESYLVSMSLTFAIFHVAAITGILWTLFVEVLFYAAAACIGRFTLYRLVLLQSLLLMAILGGTRLERWDFLLVPAAEQARYLLIICIGCAVYLAEKETEWVNRTAIVLSSLFFCYVGFQLYRFAHVDESNYGRIRAEGLAVALFLLFKWMGKSKIMNKIPQVVLWFADMVYPLYLLHAAFGLGTMALARNFSSNPYFMLVCAVAASVACAAVVHYAVEVPSIKAGRYLAKRVGKGAAE